jgi:tetratricopeptide (TPR) repeat protein
MNGLRFFTGLLMIGGVGISPAAEDRPTLVGKVIRADMQKVPYAEWYDRHYAAHEPAKDLVEKLKGPLAGVSIETYFGTWCGDSRRQIPRLLRVLDDAGFDDKHLSMTGLSDGSMEFKKAPGNPEAKRLVHRTPTIVVVRDGVEIGRIVETPKASLEADLLAILEGRGPAPKYGAEAWVHRLFSERPAAEAEKALQSAASEVSKRTDPDSLWHYAEYDLLRNGRAREAKAVLDLHLRLDPRSAIGHILLSEALVTLGQKDAARAAIDRALEIEPTNTRAKQAAEKLRTPPQP